MTLKMYNLLICIVFYLVIVPINGIPDNVVTIMIDAIVHILIPVVHQFYARRAITKPPFSVFMAYPCVYYIFAIGISQHRGYPIYPFLYTPWQLCVVVLFMAAIYRFTFNKH